MAYIQYLDSNCKFTVHGVIRGYYIRVKLYRGFSMSIEKEIVNTACDAIALTVKTAVRSIQVIKEAKKLENESDYRKHPTKKRP